jgi:glyoxylase-like metal-dependent hydrolase (beta-lactamase superfamily II)
MITEINFGNFKYFNIDGGYYFSDAGAAMGVFPRALWENKIDLDSKYRMKFNLNLGLIVTESTKILIDTGIGNRISEKEKKIYNPSDYRLFDSLKSLNIKPEEINYVVLTHLHFDHAGGIVSTLNGEDKLTFPNAIHLIQKEEWETAKSPDELNKAAYNFKKHLALLESKGNYKLIDGDEEIIPGVKLIKAGGHSNGCQIVKMQNEETIAYYAGDIIPSEMHIALGITSSYDVCRKETVKYKKLILEELVKFNGFLILNHDSERAIKQV